MRPNIALLAVFVLMSIVGIQAQGDPVDGTTQKPISAEEMEEALEETQNGIRDTESSIPAWESAARWHWWIGFSIMALGLVSSFLVAFGPRPSEPEKPAGPQPQDAAPPTGQNAQLRMPDARMHSRTALAVGLMGIAVAVLTWWLQHGFAADRRTYLKSALEARQVIGQMKTMMTVYRKKTFLDFAQALDHVKKEITPLANSLTELKKNLVASVWFEPAVYAAHTQSMRAELTETGTGDCNVLLQAEENSRVAAIEKLVARLARQSNLKPSPEDLDILRDYVAKYADKRGVDSNATVFRTTLTLGPTFASPRVFNAYLADRRKLSTPTVAERIEAVRNQFSTKKPNVSVDGFLEGSLPVPLRDGSVKLQQANRQGAFEVLFSIKRLSNGAAMASVTGVNVIADASLGSTRWSFAVLNGRNVVISLPVQRWEDSGRPTRCRIDPAAGFSAELAAPDTPLTVVGLKPKVMY